MSVVLGTPGRRRFRGNAGQLRQGAMTPTLPSWPPLIPSYSWALPAMNSSRHSQRTCGRGWNEYWRR
jgi:hypothetical protein